MGKANYIFDVVGKRGQSARGFLDMESQEIVIYDDRQGKELFRIGGKNQSGFNGVSRSTSTSKKITTLTFVVCNGSDTKQTATLFASNIEPLAQPLGVSVIVKELEKSVFNSHNYVRRDILTNGLSIRGLTYIVSNPQQFNNDLQFGTIKPYGLVVGKPFSPAQFLDKYQVSPTMMDLSRKFKWDVDARSILYVPVEPRSTVTLMFHIEIDVNESSLRKNPYDYVAESKPNNSISFEGNGLRAFNTYNADGIREIGNDDGFDLSNIDRKSASKSSSGFIVLSLLAIGFGFWLSNLKTNS